MNVDSPSRAVSDEAVLRIVREVLTELHPGRKDTDPVTLDSALEEDLGLDSLARVELLMRLERVRRVPAGAYAEHGRSATRLAACAGCRTGFTPGASAAGTAACGARNASRKRRTRRRPCRRCSTGTCGLIRSASTL
ncbi:acyl carrier protein [Polaromonas sp. P1(28)-8]|nr:acyl carrier protein [Polaromonas sp. P1(28)-8]